MTEALPVAHLTGGGVEPDAKAVKLGGKWPQLETTAAGQGPSNGDLAVIQSYATQCNADLGLGLSGGTLPNCPAALSTCSGDLSTCTTDLAACESQTDNAPEETGQTGCWDQSGTPIGCAGTGQDGEFQYGCSAVAHTFTDIGDGTITDNKTGLMWEKESNDAGIHSPQSDPWANAFVKIGSLNGIAFAGYTDWRLPNKNELFSLYDSSTYPAYVPGFLTACPGGCTVLTCNCGQPSSYWSSTTYEPSPANTWRVSFDVNGGPVYFPKSALLRARAVRGGS